MSQLPLGVTVKPPGFFTDAGTREWLTVADMEPPKGTPLLFPFFAEATEEWEQTLVDRPTAGEAMAVWFFADEYHQRLGQAPRMIRQIGRLPFLDRNAGSILCRYDGRTPRGFSMSGIAALSIWDTQPYGPLRQSSPSAKKANPWPHKCPACGGPALSLFTSTECSRWSCKNYVTRG